MAARRIKPHRVDTARVERMSKESREALGRRIREKREALGLSQEAIGAMVRKGQGYISRIERGEFNSRIDTIAAVAEALGLDMAISLPDRAGATKPKGG